MGWGLSRLLFGVQIPPCILLMSLTHARLRLLERNPRSGGEFEVLGLGTSLLTSSLCSKTDKLGDEGKK